MSLEHREQDIAAYQAVLDDFASGKLKLQRGQKEFVADLERRIAALEEEIRRPASAARQPRDRASNDRASFGDGSFATG